MKQELYTIREYVAKHDPHWEADWTNHNQDKWYIFYDHKHQHYDIGSDDRAQIIGLTYMSKWIAGILMDQLNNGEVILKETLPEVS